MLEHRLSIFKAQCKICLPNLFFIVSISGVRSLLTLLKHGHTKKQKNFTAIFLILIVGY